LEVQRGCSLGFWLNSFEVVRKSRIGAPLIWCFVSKSRDPPMFASMTRKMTNFICFHNWWKFYETEENQWHL
jgi:hypothetical protein